MLNVALATKGGERTGIGMHRSKNDPSILDTSEDVFGAVIPVDSHRVNGEFGVVLLMQKLHDAS